MEQLKANGSALADGGRMELMGRGTLALVIRSMQDPALRERIRKRAEEIKNRY